MEDQEILEKFHVLETRHYAFNMLVKKYQQKIYWLARKMVIDHDDADDLTQDIFIKIWKNLDGFKEASSLFTWIYKITANECLAFLNKKRRKFFLPINDVNAGLVLKLQSSSYIDSDAIQLKLQQAILKLPDKQRLVFNLKYFDDLPYERISEITEVSVGGLKANYHHAVKKIEEYLKEG